MDLTPPARSNPSRRPARSHTQRAAILTLPVSLLVLALLFYAPLAGLLVRSFADQQPAWAAYRDVLSTGHLPATLAQSFQIAGISFAAMLALGYPLAYLIRFRVPPAGRLPLLMLLVLSGSISDVVRIYAWYALLGTNGVVNSAAQAIGLTHEPIAGLLFSKFAVVVVLTTGWLPYVVIPIYTAMRGIDDSLLEAAHDLYAGRAALLRTILLPMSAPGILAAFVIVFIPVLSDFATPSLVGGPSSLMVGNFISDQLLQVGNWATAAAAASLLLLISVVLVAAAQRITRRFYGT